MVRWCKTRSTPSRSVDTLRAADTVFSMTSKSDLKYPLLAWTRPLSPAERLADWESDRRPPVFRVNPTDDPDAHELTGWWPILPPDVPQCPVCKLPFRAAKVCQRCKKLLARYGEALESVEFLTIVNKRDPPETLIWAWKEETVKVNGVWQHDESLVMPLGSHLWAYLDAHAERLLAGDPIVTAIPSRAPLINAAFHVAAEKGSSVVKLTRSGKKVGEWFQHGTTTAQRLGRTTNDWEIRPEAVVGRPVVLFDDVFVSGASMFSFAIALKAAGATEVRGVAIGRHVAHNYRDYHDALRIVRRRSPFYWSANRANVYHASR